MLGWLKKTLSDKKKSWQQRNTSLSIDVDSIENEENSNIIKLRILNPKSNGIINVSVPNTSNGAEIKLKALQQTHHDHNLIQDENLLKKFKLIRIKTKSLFGDVCVLESSDVEDNEEFLLLQKRTDSILNLREQDLDQGSPSANEVFQRTKHIPITQSSTTPAFNLDSLLAQSDLQQDMKKLITIILISSAYILGAGPYGEKLVQMYRQKIKNSLKHIENSVKVLCEMGFKRDKVLQALKLKSNNYAGALDWLIENVSMSDSLIVNAETGTFQLQNSDSKSSLDQELIKEKIVSVLFAQDVNLSSDTNIKENIESLLEIIRFYSEKDEVRPQANRNNYTDVFDWFLGTENNQATCSASTISKESPIVKVLLASPQVQMSFSNPKMFIAYLSMLEDYSTNLSMWLSDSDSSSILQFILRTYHEEKHIVLLSPY